MTEFGTLITLNYLMKKTFNLKKPAIEELLPIEEETTDVFSSSPEDPLRQYVLLKDRDRKYVSYQETL